MPNMVIYPESRYCVTRFAKKGYSSLIVKTTNNEFN